MRDISRRVFISYRRANIYMARTIYQSLTTNGYDVFLDYERMDSGDYTRLLINQIKSRPHFILVLTPSALERCSEPDDWMRREILAAIENKRNIVPIAFQSFSWHDTELQTELQVLKNYNTINSSDEYFDATMEKLRTRFLDIALDTVIVPLSSTEVQRAQQITERNEAAFAEISPDLRNAEIYYERAYQYYKERSYNVALTMFTRAITTQPDFAEAYKARGMVHLAQDKPEAAMTDFTNAIDQDPNYAEAYHNRGRVYAELEEWTEAIADYEMAIRLKSDYIHALNGRGEAFSQLKEYRKAIQSYTQALEVDDTYAFAYHNRGFVFFVMNDYQYAIRDFDAAEALMTKRNGQAIRNYKHTLKSVYFLRARSRWESKKDLDGALADVNKAIEIDGNFESANKFKEQLLIPQSSSSSKKSRMIKLGSKSSSDKTSKTIKLTGNNKSKRNTSSGKIKFKR